MQKTLMFNDRCTVGGCEKHRRGGSRKYCSMHAERARKHGSPHRGAFKPRGKCTVAKCGSPHYGKGFCLKHYKRWRRHGAPDKGGTGHGAVQKFIKDVALSDAEGCIVFPFYRNPDGYGWVRGPHGRPIGAHVYVALLRHGKRPSRRHEACHSCGNGHSGCVNPNHLYWGTRSDNVRDAIRHGSWESRSYRTGEKAAAAKFSDATIAAVRVALARGDKRADISARYNISLTHISRIKYGARPTG